MMNAFLVSTGVVALAEIGDKTQLLAFVLASRFKKPLPIIIAIFLATLLNHGLAAALGMWVTTLLNPETLRWALGLSFIGMAIWTLVPDKIDQTKPDITKNMGVFSATFIAFLLAEIGDKTQIATISLTAHYGAPLTVMSGTTLGMLLTDIPAVLIGNAFAKKIPMKIIHWAAAAIFISIGITTLIY